MNPAAEVLLKKRAAAAQRASAPAEKPAAAAAKAGGAGKENPPFFASHLGLVEARRMVVSLREEKFALEKERAEQLAAAATEAAALAQRNVELENRAALAEAKAEREASRAAHAEALAQTHEARADHALAARAHSDGRLAEALRQGEEAGKRVDELAGLHADAEARRDEQEGRAQRAEAHNAAQMRHVREAVALARAHDERADRLEREAVRLRQRAAKTDEVIACLEQCLQRTLSLFDMHRLAAHAQRVEESERASEATSRLDDAALDAAHAEARASAAEEAAAAHAQAARLAQHDRALCIAQLKRIEDASANASALAQRTFASMVPALEAASDTHRTYVRTIRRLKLALGDEEKRGRRRRAAWHEAGGPAARPGDVSLSR